MKKETDTFFGALSMHKTESQRVVTAYTIVIKYSGLAIGFGPFLGENLWQLSRLA